MVEEVLTAVLDAEQTIASELVAVAEALEDVAEDAGVTSETMDSVANAADSTRNAMGQVSATLAATEEGFDGVDLSAREAAISMEAASDAAKRVRNSNITAAASATNTARAIDDESDSFKEAFASAETLGEAKSAASRANRVLSSTAKSTKKALDEEIRAMVEMAESSSGGAEFVRKLRDSNLELSGALSKVDKDLSGMNEKVAANEVLVAAGAEEIEGLAASQTKLSAATTKTTQELQQEDTTFKEAFTSAETLAEAKNAASVANTKLSATAKQTKDKINEEVGAMFRMANTASSGKEFVDKLRNSNLMLAEAVSFSEEQIKELSEAQLADAAISQIHAEYLRRVSEEMSDVDEEAKEAALSVAGLGGAFSSTSLNIGPFNFALRRAAVQIPQLVITTGALATSLLGLASAAVIAGGALAGIFAGGLIAKADSVAASSSDIEGRIQAIQEIAANLRDVFIKALDPLVDGESVAIFEGTLESLAVSVNMLAQVADSLQGSLVEAGREVSSAFGDNTTAILTELENTVEAFLPLLVNLAEYFAEHLPNALQFFQNEGVSFTKTLGEIGKQIVGFFKTFVEVGIPILEGAITAIRGVLEAFEILADVLKGVPDSVLKTAFAFLFLTRIFDGVLSKGISIASFFVNFGSSIDDARGALGVFNSVLGGLQLTGTQRALGRLLDELDLLEPVLLNSSGAAQTAMQEFDEFNLPDPEKSLDESILGKEQSVDDAYFSNIRNKFSSLRSSISARLDGIRTRIEKVFSGLPKLNTESIRDTFSRISDTVSESLKNTRERVDINLSEIGTTVRNKASDIVGPLGSAFESVKRNVSRQTDDILLLVTSFIGDLKQRIAGINVVGAVSEGFGGITEAVSARFDEFNKVETVSETTIPAPEVKMEAMEKLDMEGVDATKDEINSAYRDIMTEVHPDQGGSAEAFKEVKQAQEDLLDDDFSPRTEQEVSVTTKTEQARERLRELGETAVDTKNRIVSSFSDKLSVVSEAFSSVTGKARQFAGRGLSAVSTGLKSLAARGVGVVSVVTGVGEAFVSAIPGLGNFERAIGNIKSGLRIISPELASLADNARGKIPTSFSEAGNVIGSFKSRISGLIPTVGSVSKSLPELSSASDEIAGALPAASDSVQRTARNLPILSSAIDDTTDSDIGFFSKLKNRLRGLTDISFGSFGIRERLSRIADVSIGGGVDTSPISNLRNKFASLVPSATGAAGALGRVRDMFSSAVSGSREFLGSLRGLIPSVSEVANRLPSLASSSDEVAAALPAASESIKDTADALPVLAQNSDTAARRLPVLADAAYENESIFSRLKRTLVGFIPSVDGLKGAFRSATSPVVNLAGAVRTSADNFASAIADIENYDDAMRIVENASSRVSERLTSLGGGALKRVRNGFGSARKSIGQYTGALIPADIGTKSLLASMKQLALAPFKAVGALGSLAATLFTQGTQAAFTALMNTGLVVSLANIERKGIPVISTMSGVAATFIAEASAATIASAATAALSVALDSIGIGLLIKAFVALIVVAGILAGVLSNVEGVSNAVSGTIDFLKGVLKSIFNFLLAVGVPAWNTFIDVLEVVGAFIFPFIDAFNRLAERLGFVSEEGSTMSAIFGAIGSAFVAIGDAIGFVIGLFQGPLNVIADIIYATIAIPLFAIVDAIVLVIDTIDYLIDEFKKLPIVQNTLSRIQEGVELIQDAFSQLDSIIESSVKFVKSMIESMANYVIDVLNKIIERANNSLPDRLEIEQIQEFKMGEGSGSASGRFSSADASAKQARENAASMTEEDNKSPKKDQAPAQKQETNNYENNEYNFGDFNMNPEEKARVKGLVQKAIAEANREKRFRDGGN